MALFKRPNFLLTQSKKRGVPGGLWTKCESCQELIYNKEWENSLKVCPKCKHHCSLSAPERIRLLVDEGTFEEFDPNLIPSDPLKFRGPKSYPEKVLQDQAMTGLKEAVMTGRGKIEGISTVLAVTDSRFIMGSMGSVVGEKITRAIEKAIEEGLHVIIVSGSGGGARMYEGCLSLMQMAKTSAALAKLSEAGLFFISVLTHPTMAGIMASFASLGDVIVAEPRALLGFTGPRVIKQTIQQELPPGFQTSEFLLAHGMIDGIVERPELKKTIAKFLNYFSWGRR
ncbi:MAG: acetyl-CoA carboxylase carboxyltransferase subunit beta [Chlamydiae bacterium]|nr:acetyl-CoA carboxylase carboxyltransferase subunit beta [Chlamydiota bacterium]MBI3265718.1 acetyl-CoA carboxylase carboxyltransferase subunit beta [Chlamydiota bacterium]